MKVFITLSVIILTAIFVSTDCFSRYYINNNFQSKLLVYEPLLSNANLVTPVSKEITTKINTIILKGDSLMMNGEPYKACDFYSNGLTLSKNHKLQWHQVIFLNRLGFINYWIASYTKSYNFYKEAKGLLAIVKENIDTLAYLETVYYCELLDPSKADIDLVKVNSIINSIDASTYRNSRLAKYYFLYLNINRQARNYAAVQYEFPKIKKVINQCHNSRAFWLFSIRIEEANNYKRRGVSEVAIHFEKELIKQVKTNSQFKDYNYEVFLNLSESCFKTGQYKEGLNLLKEIQPIVEKDKHPNFYLYYLWFGLYNYMLGDSVLPEVYYIKAEKLLADFNIKDYRLARVYYFLSTSNPNTNTDTLSSLKYLLKAAEILKSSPLFYLESYVYNYIGYYYYNINDYPNAIKYYTFLLGKIDSLLKDDTYFKSQVPKLLQYQFLQTLFERGNSYFYLARDNNNNINYLNKAYSDFSNLNKLWTRLFDNLENYEEFKVDILRSIRDCYSSQIDMGYTYYLITNNLQWCDWMFSLSQNSKVNLLNSHINDRIAQKIAGIPEDSIQKAYKIKRALDELQYNQIHSITNENLRIDNEFVISSIIEKYKEYDNYILQLERFYPEYAAYKKIDKGISRREIQSRLKDDQALIEYHFAFEGLYTFYIDKKTFKVHYYKIPENINEISDKCKEYYHLLSKNTSIEFNAERDREFFNLSNWFYQILIAPIKENAQNKRLIIIPDQELHILPFETLVSELPENNRKRQPSYLILSNSISYLYSSSQLAQNPEMVIRNARYAGIAPDYSACNLNTRPTNYYQAINDLPGALNEVNTARDYFRGKLFLGRKATKKKFFSSLSRFDIIHLAMHTSIDEDEPMNSELIFTLDSVEQEDQLHAYEVYSHNNNVQMVVLSACNTAKGILEKGEGVFNIARAFFLSGIPNIIVTQWSVTDKSSSSLMSRFYYYLSEGIPSDVAMQKAKIDMLIKVDPVKKKPYFWAGYVCYGSSTFMPPKNNVPTIIFTVGTLLIIIFVYLIFRKKLRF